jgi:hypothetical protein
MNPYTMVSSGNDTHEAAALSARLSAWHDAMVAHERRLRAGTTADACDDECPHAEARGLWLEAVAAFGPRSQQLAFLRSRAQETRRSAGSGGSSRAQAAEFARHPASEPRAQAAQRAAASAASATEV